MTDYLEALYNANMPMIDYQFIQEEFNLLKKVLK